MIILGLFAGLRRGEVAAVRGEDLSDASEEQIVLTVRRSAWGTIIKSTKSGRERCVTLGATAAREVRAHVTSLRDPRGWLFPGNEDRGDVCVESCAYMRAVRRIHKRAGLPYKGTHILRKTAATALARAGLGAWQIADFLGHSETLPDGRVRVLFKAPWRDGRAALRRSSSGGQPRASDAALDRSLRQRFGSNDRE